MNYKMKRVELYNLDTDNEDEDGEKKRSILDMIGIYQNVIIN